MQNLKVKSQKLLLAGTIFCLSLMVVPETLAHVTVKPGEVGVGARLNFVVSVPTEEAVPTTGLRLVIPEGVQSVQPNVKAGWTITLKKTGEGEEAQVTEIIWSGGNIPADQRDEFVFSAQAPASEGSLIWKAYQTYANGVVVAWENDPKMIEEHSKNNPTSEGGHDESALKPSSVTRVINDLTQATPEKMTADYEKDTENDSTSRVLSLFAIVLASVSLFWQYRLKQS